MSCCDCPTLWRAAALGHLSCCQRLLGTADINAPDTDFYDFTALMYAVREGESVETVEFLLDHGSFVDERIESRNGGSALHWACAAGNIKMVKLLVVKGHANVNLITVDGGSTPLHAAAAAGSAEVVAYLLLVGAEPNACCAEYGETALHKASFNGMTDCVRALLAGNVAGSSVFVPDMDGKVPIHRAAEEGHPDIIELIAASNDGAGSTTVNRADHEGNTPLHLAISDAVSALLALGADKNLKNAEGETPSID